MNDPQIRDLVIMGIDAAPNASGFCVFLGNKKIQLSTVAITEIDSLPWDEWDAKRIVVAIECPTMMYRGSNHAVRLAANMWEKVIRQKFGNKVEFILSSVVGKKRVRPASNIDPTQWRAAVLGKQGKGADWKTLALTYCRYNCPWVTDHNQAEAFCIATYAEAYKDINAIIIDQYKVIDKSKRQARRKRNVSQRK